jgi:cellulose synthase/poly-beta-1,6-N-acetylglucosamine synthase-like glycosyltransferase
VALLLTLVLAALAVLLLFPAAVVFFQVLMAVTRVHVPPTLVGERGRVAVIMPAHNEATIIDRALRAIILQLGQADRLIVVADNCSDDTAAVAARERVEVLVRTDLARRGKGYALDFGVRQLESDPPDLVIIIDADCLPAAGAVETLARLCTSTSRPIQALYLMHAAEDAPLNMRAAEFAWVIKNHIRPEGMHRMGLPCQMMGTGMAIPWARIKTANLATGNIVEDLKLGIDLALAGALPLFCPDALVSSEFPTSLDGAQGQRTRWEHGHLNVILTEAPRLLLKSIYPPNIGLLSFAIDLSVPPMALLTLLVGATWCATALFAALTHELFPLALTSAAATLIGLSVLLSWARYGRSIISFGSLMLGVVYPLLKLPLYGRFLVARQLEWVRSKRDDDPR